MKFLHPTRFFITATIILSFYTPVKAQFPSALVINNLCQVEVYALISSSATRNCDHGPSQSCTSPFPSLISPYSLLTFPWITNSGTSIKLTKSLSSSTTSPNITSTWQDAFSAEIFQFEYTYNPALNEGEIEGIYWDPSDLDGKGAGRVGTPWEHDNVAVAPAGMGVEEGSCWAVFCAKDEVCRGAYQSPGDVDTKFCGNVDAIFITLCTEDGMYNLY